ncbi:6667_t:CDS:2, partial [Scutellospora calospora]
MHLNISSPSLVFFWDGPTDDKVREDRGEKQGIPPQCENSGSPWFPIFSLIPLSENSGSFLTVKTVDDVDGVYQLLLNHYSCCGTKTGDGPTDDEVREDRGEKQRIPPQCENMDLSLQSKQWMTWMECTSFCLIIIPVAFGCGTKTGDGPTDDEVREDRGEKQRIPPQCEN